MAAIEMPNVKYSHDNFSLFLFCTFFLLFLHLIFSFNLRAVQFSYHTLLLPTHILILHGWHTRARRETCCVPKNIWTIV